MSVNRFSLTALALLSCASLAAADHVRGVVVKTDTDARTLTIEARGVGVRGTVLTFTLGKDAQIVFGRQPATLKDVPAGKRVQVTYETKDGKRVAVLVHVNNLMLRDTPAPAAPANDPNALTGKLRRVAYTEREIVLAMPGAGDKENYVTLPVAADATITRDDKAIKFDELKEEATAVVRTAMRDGKKVATAVLIGKVTMPQPAASARIARIREILKILDAILEEAQKMAQK